MMEKTVETQSIWPLTDKDRPGGTRKAMRTTEDTERKNGRIDLILDQDIDPDVPDDDSTIGYLVRDVHRAFSRALQGQIASHGVSMGQWFFLRALWEEDGLTQRELSQRVGMMEPTTVTALNSMERRGLVERVRNPHDRRKVNIFLTPKGRSLRDVLLPCSRDVNTMAIDGIDGNDVARTLAVLRRIMRNLSANGLEVGHFGNGKTSHGREAMSAAALAGATLD